MSLLWVVVSVLLWFWLLISNVCFGAHPLLFCRFLTAVCGSRGPGLADAEPRGPVAGANTTPWIAMGTRNVECRHPPNLRRNPKMSFFFPIETQKCRVFSNRRIFQSQSFGVVKFWREQPSKMLILPAKKKVYQPTTWNDSQYPDGFFWKNMQWPEISEWSLLPGMVSWLYCLPKIPKISIIIIYLDMLPHRFIIFCSFIPICCLDVLTQNCWSNPNLCCKLNAMNVQLGTA